LEPRPEIRTPTRFLVMRAPETSQAFHIGRRWRRG